MSNETLSDKKPQPPAPKQDHLTRVPVKHIYFTENFDLAFGSSSSQLSNIKCYEERAGNPWWEARFIPAWQQIEVVAMRGTDRIGEPQMVPMHHIKRWLQA